MRHSTLPACLLIVFFGLVRSWAAPAAPAPKIVGSAYNFHRLSVFEAVEKTAACGIHYLETFTNQRLSPDDATKIYELSDAQISALKAHLEKHGVSIVSCMLGLPKDEAKARAVFERVRKLGARNIGTDVVDALDVAEKLAKEFNITVAFHNHPADPQRPEYRNNDPFYMRERLQGRDPRVGVCADTGHYASSGVVPIEAIRTLDGRIQTLHLKERSAIGSRTPDSVYGTGVLDIAGILRELQRQAFTGLIVIEYEGNVANKTEDVTACAKYLEQHLASASTAR